MAFVITTSHQNPRTNAVHFSSTAGIFQGQVAHLGSEKESTLVRGFLLAAIIGLNKIKNLIGAGGEVDLLVPDEVVAEKFRSAGTKMLGKFLRFDDEELWGQFVALKNEFKLAIFSYPDEATGLSNLWRWQRDPSLMTPGVLTQ